MGKPVALEAKAEERETRGFISMITMRPLSGFTANWMLDPPVSTPTARITANEASRMIWNSLSVSVWMGATVMESPVWTPIGSKFSMEQMTTQLSLRSRMTSISNSFQPEQRFLDENLGHGGEFEAALGHLVEFLAVIGDAAAGAAEGKRRADDEREAANLLGDLARLLGIVGRAADRHVQADGEHQILEHLAVLTALDGLGIGADHLDAVLVERPAAEKGHRGVERGLAAERRQQAPACRWP